MEADLAFAMAAAAKRVRAELAESLAEFRAQHLTHVEQINLLLVRMGGRALPAAPGSATELLSRYRPGPAPDEGTTLQLLLHRELSLFERYVAATGSAEVDSEARTTFGQMMRDVLSHQAWLSAAIADLLEHSAQFAQG